MRPRLYSRELRKLTLFYLPKPKDALVFESIYSSITRKKAAEIRLPGVVISSLRPVYVYLRADIAKALEMSKAYVVRKSTSNASLHVKYSDEIIDIDDTKRLKEITGKPTPLPIRLLYMLKDKEKKARRENPEELVEAILKDEPVYALTCWTKLLDYLFAHSNPDKRVVNILIVWNNLVKIWSIPKLHPLEYLSIDRIRWNLHIPEDIVTRIVVYEPSTKILLIVQPLQSITLEDLRKILFRRPRIPVSPEEAIKILKVYIKDVEDQTEQLSPQTVFHEYLEPSLDYSDY